ncbi:universal stress protein UspA [Tenacibaculum sp. SZ-18]|uniref:universal stress protein n=1 Tax=Tenacibaculum sp. SZ-18 TaxID=754423 RepID=UPI000C2D17C8|nr:universal stress protein [Tenacibaculum sp. SZ-18]AUC14199.1 universal stress protein UspA [Tenacibaculum sp. SZ-18]
MKKVLVPIDFSEQSENALITAANFAKKFKFELVVLHMLELSNAIATNTVTTQETIFYLKLIEKKLNEFLDKKYLKDIKITPIIKHYKIFSELNDLCKEENINLVFMGSQGATGFKELFIGSNAQKVIRNSDIPVLVVKNNPMENFENAVFACDFSKDSIEAYKQARKFAEKINCKMKMIYVNTPSKSFKSSSEMREIVKNFFEKAETKADYIKDVQYVSDYTIEAGIINFAQNHNADIIAMATHGRKGLLHFFDGSITEDVANHSPVPVLSFKIGS